MKSPVPKPECFSADLVYYASIGIPNQIGTQNVRIVCICHNLSSVLIIHTIHHRRARFIEPVIINIGGVAKQKIFAQIIRVSENSCTSQVQKNVDLRWRYVNSFYELSEYFLSDSL